MEGLLKYAGPIGTCLLLSATYLLSLYVWMSPYRRDHPSTIKKRFFSVFCMLFISPCYVILGMNKSVLEQNSLLYILGLRREGIVQATVLPLILTALLFLGPLYSELSYKCYHKNFEKNSSVGPPSTDNYSPRLIWIRNHIVAPLSEEFTYRSCMLSLLFQCFSPMVAISLNPLFFGIAHIHHIKERLDSGMNPSLALKISCFQLLYTTIFGTYSAYLFHRTGHFVTVFVVHAFCNFMGFPSDLLDPSAHSRSKKWKLCFFYLLGFISWCLLLNALTEPKYYYNEPRWYDNIKMKN